ncbi:Vancomycin resistance protein YoaR, contains peptidoglycan-binding and VanW domains [Geodermatophilus saharensis]|uniref:Vancomycin resistance protein YoaR, contains peptidoglycan-binding and VanW domains n=1 Tax=Geodermatophilus saharensis TaxID=1137994 RepID=A0A239E4A0_9ACTN|nr:VanW family protein [Geodermatophilus saharensis]SNS39580.1 Vancomycin resistance protein YoaR, contains peptidoglycan-binding and VanW domains [Geodermatophilus saharensis]
MPQHPAPSPAPTARETTSPDDTAPDDTSPDDTSPDDTAPDDTAPDGTAPESPTAERAAPATSGPGGFSDDTRPVPRDRGPVGPDAPAPPAAPAPRGSQDGPQEAPAEDADAARRDAEQSVGTDSPAEDTAPDPVHDTVTLTGGPPASADTAHATEPVDVGPPAAVGRAPADLSDTVALTGAAVPAEAPPATAPPATAPPATATGPTSGPATGAGAPGAGGPPPPPAGAASPRRPWRRRPAALVPVGLLAVLGVAYGVDLLVAGDDLPRNTVVAGVDVGGLSHAAAATELEERLAPRVSADHVVVADDVETTLSPATAGITLDVDATVDAADDQPLNPWTRLVSFFDDREVTPVITGEETALAAQVDTIATQVDRAPVDATVTLEGTTPSVVEPADGRTLDREGAAEAITTALASGGDPQTPIELPVDVIPVRVGTEEAQRVLDETVTPALAAPVTVTSQDGATSVEIPVEAIAASLTFTPQDSGELAVAVDPAALQTAMGEDFAAFGTPPQDARFEVGDGAVRVVPSVDGTGVDPDALAGQLLEVLPDPAPRTVTAELGAVPADLTTQEAEALGIREEVSSFTTTTTNDASGTNIRVVAEEVDGALVLPGETFSLNGYTGPRGTAQGYVPANVISGGELSTAVGGGISQFATTMFNAVFFAGLEDVYHKPHSFYISRYPAGREATVYEGQIDLQWRNDTDTGIYVDTQWAPAASGGSITVTFYGTKRYEVEAIEGPRTNFRQPAVQEKVDDGDCIPQSGVQGFDVTVTRVFRDLQSGAEIRRERFDTTYAAEAVIRCVAPPPADPAPAPDGGTPPAQPTA